MNEDSVQAVKAEKSESEMVEADEKTEVEVEEKITIDLCPLPKHSHTHARALSSKDKKRAREELEALCREVAELAPPTNYPMLRLLAERVRKKKQLEEENFLRHPLPFPQLPPVHVVTLEEEEKIRQGALADTFSLTEHNIRSGSLFTLLWEQLKRKLHWTWRIANSQKLYFKSEEDARSLTTEDAIEQAMCVRVFRYREQVERFVTLKIEIEREYEKKRQRREHAQLECERERLCLSESHTPTNIHHTTYVHTTVDTTDSSVEDSPLCVCADDVETNG